MRVGAGLACRSSFASTLPSLHSVAAGVRWSSSASYPSTVSVSTSTSTSIDHISFIRDVAVANPPERLRCLLNMLQARVINRHSSLQLIKLLWRRSDAVAQRDPLQGAVQGETIVPPEAKEGLIPLIIPLSESFSGALTSLLRWPTSPPGMEMPVVEVRKHGVWYLAKSVDQYIHRMVAEEDAKGIQESKFWDAAADLGRELYNKGDFISSGITDLDSYLLKKVGLFPDVIERKVARHLQREDHVSALVTGEFYTRNHFLGFGRPFVFNAEILFKVGRKPEAKEAARGALKLPWWTLGCRYQEVAEIAQWEDEQIEYIKEKVTDEGKKEDLKKGKMPEQVALDEAAFLLDLASIDGSWDEVVDRVAQCYMEAGLSDVANFVKYTG